MEKLLNINLRILKRLKKLKRGEEIKIYKKDMHITPHFVNVVCNIYNGNSFKNILILESMVGRRFGEYVQTRKFVSHPDKKQSGRK